MRIAVIGAGLAGLSVAWHALQKGFQVTLFDHKGVGGGASGVSTGLLHPFAGKKGTLSYRAEEGMRSTKELLQISENALHQSVASFTGIFRPAITSEQKNDFQKNSALWKELVIQDIPMQGLWIEGGITVFSRAYLKGLFLACQELGALFFQEKITDLPDGFDRVILTTGSDTIHFDGCQHLPCRTAIGQSLVCRWENPLPCSLASQGYISVTEDPHLCQVGSTYEHTDFPDPKKAVALLEKVALFYPPAKDFEIIEIRSGKRISPQEGHTPIITQVSKNTWVFMGLGSRGMLYHALYGKELVSNL